MQASMIAGEAVVLAKKLWNDHGWNGTLVLATPIMVVESGAVVDTHWAVLGGLRDLTFNANLLWLGTAKELKVTVKLTDLNMFTFTRSNLHFWLDRSELEVTFTHTNPAQGEEAALNNSLSFEQARLHGADKFSLRALICPVSHTRVSL